MDEAATSPQALVVRRATSADAEAIAAFYRANHDFFAPFEPVRAEEALEADAIRSSLAAEAELAHAATIVAIDRAHGSVVGRARISNVARGPFQSCTLGYGVAQRWNGLGIAQRLVRASTDLAFNEFGLHRIEAGTLVDNVASQRVLERCGFVRIGISRKHLQIAGTWSDHVLFSRTVEDVSP